MEGEGVRRRMRDGQKKKKVSRKFSFGVGRGAGEKKKQVKNSSLPIAYRIKYNL